MKSIKRESSELFAAQSTFMIIIRTHKVKSMYASQPVFDRACMGKDLNKKCVYQVQLQQVPCDGTKKQLGLFSSWVD